MCRSARRRIRRYDASLGYAGSVPWPRIAGCYGVSALHGHGCDSGADPPSSRTARPSWQRRSGSATRVLRLVELTRLITLEKLRGRFNLALGTGASASVLASTAGGPVTRRRATHRRNHDLRSYLRVSSRREPERAGQAVAVIGGSAGIGPGAARRARAEGADVVLTGRNPGRLPHAAAKIGARQTGPWTRTTRPRSTGSSRACRPATRDGRRRIGDTGALASAGARRVGLIKASRKSKPSVGRVVEAGQDTDAVAGQDEDEHPAGVKIPRLPGHAPRHRKGVARRVLSRD
jgi:hypothetical protein